MRMSLYSMKIDLKTKMLQKGYSLTELSKKLGVNLSYLSQIVSGKRSPSPILAKKIADTLDVKIEDVFEVKTKKEG